MDEFTRQGFADMTDDELRSEIAHYTDEAAKADNETRRAMALEDVTLYTAILEDRS